MPSYHLNFPQQLVQIVTPIIHFKIQSSELLCFSACLLLSQNKSLHFKPIRRSWEDCILIFFPVIFASPCRIHCVFTFVLLFSVAKSCHSLHSHGLQHTRPLCPLLSPRVCSNLCPLSCWCYLTLSSSGAPSPSAFDLSQHHGLFLWVSPSLQVAKVLELQLQHQSFQWIFRIDFL